MVNEVKYKTQAACRLNMEQKYYKDPPLLLQWFWKKI
jgi:hypothetical protein